MRSSGSTSRIVAMALGGVAQMDRDGIISVTRPESDRHRERHRSPRAKPEMRLPRVPSVLH